MSITRTSSPYFSPNSIMAPVFCASSIGHHARTAVAALARISALTMASTSRICVVGQRRVVREVEARLVGIDQRALLLHVRAQHFAQRLVHQVRGRVVAHGAACAHAASTFGRHRVADLQRAGLQHAVMAEHVGLDFLRVVDLEDAAAPIAQLAAVADLAAAIRRRTACGRARRRPSSPSLQFARPTLPST